MAEILQVPDNNNGANAAMMAAMMGGGGMGMWNSPMALFALPLMYGMMGNGWGGWGNNNRGGYGGGAGAALAGADAAIGAATQAQVSNLGTQVQGLSSQIQDNANFGQLGTSIEGVKSQLGDLNVGMVGAFANVAQDINGVQSAIQNTGCGIKTAILEQGAANQLANCQQTNTILQQSQNLQNTVQNGFTNIGFQLERNACDIKETSTANTQKIVDTLNSKWATDSAATITQLRDELATLRQTQALVAALGGTAATASTKTTATT